ncbi:ABC transporter ATP-binding protein [Paraburkholderia tuberum]|uniref:Amino acid/amide ABC transporter ATP-binding protein 1, HAAT family n=1 Tax=Paraburkholderia tuberum TaxID=157910 RepID=A0A1H1KHU7_9BURK|nr:ABC transporter ATP-binding protein [Paraburkholderia tuberum]SDR61560.1 amino acid/amide ABC transporter ATP-binding protein 1, HAAT family [Paraburkholderia tuberum]
MSPLLEVKNLVKRFRGFVATNNATLDVLEGEIHALIGPNGAGKSTLINQLSGELVPDEGRIVFRGQDVTAAPTHRRAQMGLVRSYQITSVFNDMTALENVMLAVQGRTGRNFGVWTPTRRDRDLIGEASEALLQVGLETEMNTPVSEMAHGARRQLELAMALALKPRLMLLDEPLAGMSQVESEAMVALLKRFKSDISMLLIEHDMDAVFELADRVTVLVSGQPIETGTPDQIRCSQTVQEAYLGEPSELM